MALTAQKTCFSKSPPKEMLHRDYKNTEEDKFKHEVFCGFTKLMSTPL